VTRRASAGRRARFRSRELYFWALLAGIAVALTLGAYFVLPGVLVPDDLGRAAEVKARNDVRGSGVQLVGALAVAVGTFLTARTYLLNRQAALTERLTKAVDQLGDDQLAVRLGGIEALRRLAEEDPSQHVPIMRLLAAHVREEVPWKAGAAVTETPQDVLAVLDALSSRAEDRDPPGEKLDLRSVDLRRTRRQGIRLNGVNLSGAHLEDSRFTSSPSFADSAFVGTVLDRARLKDAVLVNADLRAASLIGADLRGCDLDGADLTGAKLFGADLTGALNAQLAAAQLDAGTRCPDGSAGPHCA
jgi:hypothetical protein